MNESDYEQQAHLYALRDVGGTDFIAFRAVAERGLLRGRDVLDFGCGAGRSTRFVRDLGNRVTGVDASAAMIAQARRRDPHGDYRLVPRHAPLPFRDGEFDAVFSSWALIEEGNAALLARCFAEFARVLRAGGMLVVIANTREFYAGHWLSCDVDFPENAPPLKSGRPVRARLLPQRVEVHDYFWDDDDYARFARAAGLELAQSLRPLGRATDPFAWRDESRAAPYVVHVFGKQEPRRRG